MKPAELSSLLKKTVTLWGDADAPSLGAALAYYTAFSLAPLLVIALAIAGLIFGPEAARGEVKVQIEGIVGSTIAQGIQDMLQHADRPGSGPLALVVGVVVLLFGASGVFGELQHSLNTLWRLEPKPGRGILGLLRDRLLSFGMVLATCFVLLTSLILTTVLASLAQFWTPTALPGGTYLWQALNQAVSFAVVTLLFALIYRFVPDARTSWRDLLLGAAITTLLFTLGKYLLGLYLGRSSLASAYGAAGSLAVILFWVYYSAQIFLLGAAFTRVYAEHYGRGVRPTENAVVARKEPVCSDRPAAEAAGPAR